MQDKQKVTLYLPQELHRRLKIQSAVESEPMSALVERAVVFYLEHPEALEGVVEDCGQTHRVYSCPTCTEQSVLRDGELVSLNHSSAVIDDENLSLNRARSLRSQPNAQPNIAQPNVQGEGELVSV